MIEKSIEWLSAFIFIKTKFKLLTVTTFSVQFISGLIGMVYNIFISIAKEEAGDRVGPINTTII